VVVPEHNLVWGEPWIVAAANNSKDVAPKEHLNNPNATIEF
jgi:hypothetical protein